MAIIHLDEFKKETLTGFIDALKMPFSEKLLPFLPRDKKVYSLNFAYEIITAAKSTAAQILDFGAPSPLRDKGTIETLAAEVAKLAHKYRFDQKDQLTLLNAKFDTEKHQALMKALQSVVTLTEGVYKTEEYMRAAAIYKGKLLYKSNGVALDIDFGIPAGNKIVLTGTDKWSDYANATPLQDLIEWTALFKKKNANKAPVTIHMPFDIFWNMTKCASTVASIKGNSGGAISIDDINDFLKRFNVPPIETQDEVVDFETGDERLLPENRVVMLGIQGVQLGYTVEGPTVENNATPGIYSRTWTDQNTLDEFVEVGKAAFPELNYPTGIMHFDVV